MNKNINDYSLYRALQNSVARQEEEAKKGLSENITKMVLFIQIM